MNTATYFRSAALAAVCAATIGCASASAQEDAAASPTPQEALDRLMAGNERFAAGEDMRVAMTPSDRAKLSEGQSPHAIIVGCSDSRVPLELVFDAQPGELFVIRDAGNIVDDNEIATIEYGVAVLKSPLLVVLGHESCGAVDAAVKSEKGEASFDGHIHDLVEDIRPSVEAAMQQSDAQGSELLAAAVKANVRRVVDELERSKPYIGKAFDEGKLMIVPAKYDLDTGKVELLDMTEGDHKGHGHGEHDHGM